MIKTSPVGRRMLTVKSKLKAWICSRGFRSKLDDGRSLPGVHSLRNKSRGCEAAFLIFPPRSWCFREQQIHPPELNLALILSICSSSPQHSITVIMVYFESISPVTWQSLGTCKEVRSLTPLCSGKCSGHKLFFIRLELFQTETLAAIKRYCDNDDDHQRTGSVPKWLLGFEWEKGPLLHLFWVYLWKFSESSFYEKPVSAILNVFQRYKIWLIVQLVD